MPTVRAVLARLRHQDLDAECVLTESDVSRPGEFVALDSLLAEIDDDEGSATGLDDDEGGLDSDDALDHARSLDEEDLVRVGGDEEDESW